MIDAPPRGAAWYVYGIVDGRDRAVLSVAPEAGFALGAGAVDIVERDGLAAIVSRVDEAEFGDAALAERLNDRAWLEETARVHEAVLQLFAAAGTIVPLRFGTIYRSREDVAALLDERRSLLEGDLAFVRNRSEVGVKLWAATAAPSSEDEREAPATGRDYLERRRTEREQARSDAELRHRLVRSVHERLTGRAAAAVVNRPQPRELTGRDEEMLLNAAYLVERGDVAAFANAAEDLAAEAAAAGVSLELTGPWPPHNFVGRESADS